jgi:hypothetical protein
MIYQILERILAEPVVAYPLYFFVLLLLYKAAKLLTGSSVKSLNALLLFLLFAGFTSYNLSAFISVVSITLGLVLAMVQTMALLGSEVAPTQEMSTDRNHVGDGRKTSKK